MKRYGRLFLFGFVAFGLVTGCVFVSGTPLPQHKCRTNADCPSGLACIANVGEWKKCLSCGQTLCDDACVDVQTNGAHCGSCGNVCSGGQVCSNGSCVSTATAGQSRSFTVGGTVFVTRWIPAGTFLMGSPSTEAERLENEGPQRSVEISKGFWMMESEVTQGQWKALMGSNPSFFSSCGDNCPVETVSWYEAAMFANEASKREGLSECFACSGGECKGIGNEGSDYLGCTGWRLPTEAEWEYAARAGTTTPFHTGNCISTDQANYYGNNPYSGCAAGTYRERPIGVCSLARNAWNLCDMHGNVWEWVYDWFDGYGGMGTRDPLRTSGGTERVNRGGGWYSHARAVRSAPRDDHAPAVRSNALGFRLLRY